MPVSDPGPQRPLLVLGGTPEGLALAHRLDALHGAGTAIYSLAGVAPPRTPLPVRMRSGGFGGVEGLRAFLAAESIRALIDATHPFAATMSANARHAAGQAGIPRLTLRRLAWEPMPGDHWHRVPDVESARSALPDLGRHALLTLGRGDAARFAGLGKIAITARLLNPEPPYPGCPVVVGRGPFAPADEEALFRRLEIDVLVTKNSGGTSGLAKLAAARALTLPVVMIDRPTAEPGPLADSVEVAVQWVKALSGP